MRPITRSPSGPTAPECTTHVALYNPQGSAVATHSTSWSRVVTLLGPDSHPLIVCNTPAGRCAVTSPGVSVWKAALGVMQQSLLLWWRNPETQLQLQYLEHRQYLCSPGTGRGSLMPLPVRVAIKSTLVLNGGALLSSRDPTKLALHPGTFSSTSCPSTS